MNFREKLISLGDAFYYATIGKNLVNMETVLDVGCGVNSPLAKIKKNFYSVGFDIFEPSIKKSKKAKIHDKYVTGDILKMKNFFKPKSFDAVIALDVIEHFEKKDGWKLLNQMEKIAKKKIVIFTPSGFTQQHPYDGNPYQIHKSGWDIDDFKKLGFSIFGMRGFRFIRGEYATIKYKPWFIWGIISVLSQFLVYYNPLLAYQLLAIKELNKQK
ncbi:MAG: methyltransferase domain-containing protein [Candidatus Levybacteria bacterium]|nr:methyltransferase domain-containing protein [Candidatus Levybacteria bacterium]